MKISLAGPSYTSASVNAACQQTMNLIPEPIEVPNEPVRMVLYGRPGLKWFAQLSPTKIRCLWAGGGRLFAIHGPNQSEIHEDGTITLSPGTVAQQAINPDPAQIISNGHQRMIVSAGQVYCDSGSGPVPVKMIESGLGNTSASAGTLVATSGIAFDPSWASSKIYVDNTWYIIASVTNATTLVLYPSPPDATGVTWQTPQGDLLDGITGAFLDGYFIVNRTPVFASPTNVGRQFNISWLNEGTMWDPLDFGVKEEAPDNIQSILVDSEALWLLGRETTEIWSNVGDPNFPFQRITGASIHKGSVAVYAPCSAGLSVCWLAGGADGQTIALQARGLQPKRISTYAQESAWNAPNFAVWDVVSYSYADGGHVYWVVLFWQQQACWVYDLTTEMWHERAAWDPTSRHFLRYWPWYHVFLPEWGPGGKHIVGNPSTGILYEQSIDYYNDDGSSIEYLRAFPHLINENEYAYHHRLEAMVEMGTQSPTDPVPLIGLDWSDDHGHTFRDSVSRLVPMAPSGNYTQRAVFRRLGKARDRVYRIGIQATSKVALIDAYLEMTQGFA